MNAARTLAVVLAAIATLGVFFLFQPSEPGLDGSHLEPGTSAGTESPRDRSDPELGTQDPKREVEAAPSQLGPRKLASEVSGGTQAAQTYGPHELEVVIGATGEPAAGAMVAHLSYVAEPPEELLLELISRSGELPQKSIERAETYKADAAGHVRVPAVEHETLVVAQLGDLVGYLALDSELGSGERVELFAPRDLGFLIQDASGQRSRAYKLQLDGLAPGFHFRAAPGAPDLSGVLHNVDSALRAVQRATKTGAPFELRAAAVRGDATFAEVGFDLTAKRSTPILLEVPAGRAVFVDVLNLDGEVMPNRRFHVELVINTEGTTCRLSGRTSRGRPARFLDVPFGAMVTASFEGEESDSVRVPGPAADEFHLTLKIDENSGPVVWGRLLDAGGVPLAKAEFTWKFAMRMNPTGSSWNGQMNAAATTNEDGEFHIDAGSFFTYGNEPETVWALDFAAEGPDGVPQKSSLPWLHGQQELPMALGDVSLVPMELVAAGRVVDGAGAGEPIEGAAIKAFAAHEDLASEPDAVAAPRALALDRQYHRLSDAKGRFRVFGEVVSGRVFVEASAEGYGKGVRQACEVGATGLELVLEKSGTMAGSVRLPAVTTARFSLGIRPEDPDRAAGFSARREFDSLSTMTRDGITWGLANLWAAGSEQHLAEFRWLDLAPGRYTLILWASGVGEQFGMQVLKTWNGVEVASGKETLEPTLQHVDGSALVEALEAQKRKGE